MSTFPIATLLSFTNDALRACGLPERDAAITADAMIEADLTGADAHGIFRLASYVKVLQQKRINPNAQNADRQPRSRDRADRRRQRHGASGDDPCGRDRGRACARSRVSAGSEAAAPITPARLASMRQFRLAHGMIGLYAACSSVNHMAPTGGAEPLLGTNPIAVGDSRRRGAAGDARHRYLGDCLWGGADRGACRASRFPKAG